MKIICNWTRALSAAILTTTTLSASAGTELIQNGDFEAGNATDQTWGSYSNKSGYSNPGWTVSSGGGLAKPNGTWIASGLAMGNWAIFLQNNAQTAYQDVTVPAAGTYRLSFNWTARPSHGGQTIHVKFGDAVLDTFTTSATVLMHWQKDFEVPAAGTYRLMFESQTSDGDRATCFDAVSLRALDDARVWTGGGSSDSIADAGNWGGTPGETITFMSDDYLVFDKAATVTVPADITVKGVKITGDGIVELSGAGKINVASDIYSDASTDMVFNCPVAFNNTYFVVKQGNGRVKFPGGVTATYPETTLRTDIATVNEMTLDGDFTFTEDWIVNNVGDRPWIVASNSVVRGQNFSGTQTSHHRILRVEETGYACFTTTTNGWDRGDLDIDGMLEATKEVVVKTASSGSTASRFGRSGNIGTVKAPRIVKCEHVTAQSLIPNLIVGAGGIGSVTQDYTWRFEVDTTITATDDFEVLAVYRSAGLHDWGIGCSGTVTLTFNVPEGKTVTYGTGFSGTTCTIRKTGAGTLVMTDTFNGNSGFLKQYANGTVIEEGTVRLAANGQLGTGPVTIARDARLEIANGVTISNQVDGEGTLYLEDGVTLTMGNIPWSVGEVEVASGASVSVTNSSSGAFAFLTGVSASDLASFSFGDYPLTVAGDTLCYVGDTTGAYVWNGASGADWSVPGNWLVDGAIPATAPVSTDTIIFQNAAPITIGGTDTLTVTKIITSSDDLVTFNCPVAFAGTYLVENAATAPLFAGGATASIPDAALTSMNIPSHAFNGTVTFTEDWTVPHQTTGKPFVVTAGSSIFGKKLEGTTYTAGLAELRIDEGAVATFESIDIAGKLVFKLNGGRLVATGDITLSNADFGDYQGNIGTVEANGVYKSVRAGNIVNYVTNFVVGAGGFGMYRADYNFQFKQNTRLTAKDNLTIYMPLASDGSKENDWGLNLDGKTLTIDTAGHTVTFDSCTTANAGVIVKEGEGEMIMQNRLKQHTGGTILNGGLTTVKTSGALGYGTATVNSGATLAFSADQMLAQAYPIVVNDGGTLVYTVGVSDTSTLTLNAGSVLKPTQGAIFSVPDGSLTLPEEGTVTLDLRDFSFVNGVATSILGGTAAGDEAKFTVLVPAGVNGALSVSGGFLYYTPTSGGSAAGDLFWHPAGDAVWSTSIAAWTNAAGSQVSFTPYANATIADAATISLPEDVPGNDVTVATDGDVTLTGAGTLGGIGNVTKRGSGTLTLDGANFDGQNFTIAEGKVVLGDNAGAYSLGTDSGSVGGTVTIQEGGQFNVNTQNTTGNATDARFEITHLKTFSIAGDGPDGRGAIVNDSLTGITTGWGPALRRVELADDATIGGANRYDVRVRTGTAATSQGGIFGPGKQLTVKCPGYFGLISLPIDVGSVLITDGGVFRPENVTSMNIPGGITLDNGTLHGYATTYPAEVPIYVAANGGTINSQNGTTEFNGPIVVTNGATLTLTGSYTANYNGSITNNGTVTATAGTHNFTNGELLGNGTWNMTGGTVNIDYADALRVNLTPSGGTMNIANGAPTSGWTLNGTRDAEIVRLRQSGTYTGANINAFAFGVADVADSTVDVTFLDSTINIGALSGSSGGLYLGWGGIASGSLTIGPGTTLTTTKICVGDNGTSTSGSIRSVFTVDGGTVNLTEDLFYIAHNGPHSDFIMNSGTMNVRNAPIRLRNSSLAFGGGNTSRFIQNGGTFNYGGSGFLARFEDNTDEGQIVLKGGVFNASANWSIPHFISTCFKDGDANGWTLTQTNGTTATWNTALTGDGDVTLNGTGTLVGNKEMQGVVGGRWTVGDGFTAGLQGAASLLGGLDIGEGASVTVNIATNRSAVFTARDFGDRDLSNANSIVGRFNKKPGGTTRGTITHDETLLFTNYAQAARPFGDMNNTETYAVGHFYVEESKTGTWSFEGRCDDRVALWIDGEQVMISTADCDTVTGTKEITTAGWHSFRHVISDNSGGFGPAANHAYHTVGYKDPTMSAYARFNVKNLKMRPAADMGDPNNANTIRWSHYKGTATDVTASTFKRDDFAWDFCCITNNLQKLTWYGSNDATYMNGYTVNRYEGWFYVTAENAGKAWTFRSNYDDRAALWIDGVDSGLTGDSNNTLSYTVTLAQGWHKFRIQTADFTGNAGPWSGQNKKPVSYQVAGGAETLFSEATLPMTVCPDGYIQGGVTLASNATLSNGAIENAAVIYGDVTATGTGATMSGAFKFDGGTLAFQNVAPNANDLSTVLAFTAPAADYLADVGAITVDFTEKPTRSKVTVGPAGGLTAETAAQKVRVTVNGEPAVRFRCLVENGDLKIRLARGTVIYVR